MQTRFVLFFTLILTSATAICLAAQNMGPKEIKLVGGSRGEIRFPHSSHQAKLGDCKVCHNLFPQSIGGIAKLKAEGKLKPKQIMNKHCIKCHKAEKRAGNPSGPTTCAKCHIRK